MELMGEPGLVLEMKAITGRRSLTEEGGVLLDLACIGRLIDGDLVRALYLLGVGGLDVGEDSCVGGSESVTRSLLTKPLNLL